jgi:hypothetical protein
MPTMNGLGRWISGPHAELIALRRHYGAQANGECSAMPRPWLGMLDRAAAML